MWDTHDLEASVIATEKKHVTLYSLSLPQSLFIPPFPPFSRPLPLSCTLSTPWKCSYSPSTPAAHTRPQVRCINNLMTQITGAHRQKTGRNGRQKMRRSTHCTHMAGWMSQGRREAAHRWQFGSLSLVFVCLPSWHRQLSSKLSFLFISNNSYNNDVRLLVSKTLYWIPMVAQK